MIHLLGSSSLIWLFLFVYMWGIAVRFSCRRTILIFLFTRWLIITCVSHLYKESSHSVLLLANSVLLFAFIFSIQGAFFLPCIGELVGHLRVGFSLLFVVYGGLLHLVMLENISLTILFLSEHFILLLHHLGKDSFQHVVSLQDSSIWQRTPFNL